MRIMKVESKDLKNNLIMRFIIVSRHVHSSIHRPIEFGHK